MRELGFDYDTELQRLTEELPLIEQDILRAGSPYQLSDPGEESGPSGDSGRPKGQPTNPKRSVNPVKVVKDKTKVKSPSQGSVKDTLLEHLGLDATSLKDLVSILSSLVDETDKTTSAQNPDTNPIGNVDLKSLIEG
jgi:hypothetical protein